LKKITFLTLLLLALNANSLFSKTITVHPGEKLQAAIHSARPGDTILLKSGTHITKKDIIIRSKTNLTIKGEKKAKIVCDNPDTAVISIISSRNIQIINIFATHREPENVSACTGSVILIYDCKGYVKIDKCDLNGCGSIGVEAFNSEKIQITNSFIHNNNWAGIVVKRIKKLFVQNCIIVNNNNSPFEIDQHTNITKKDNIVRN